MDLADRRVLVTGATGGVGQAIVRRLGREGARVVATGRRTEVLSDLAREAWVEAVSCDLATAAGVRRLIARAGPVDVLVANAALPAAGPLNEYTERQIDRALAVNLRAPLVLAKAFSDQMAAGGGGHIVFVSSLAGKWPLRAMPLHTATKFGLRGASLVLRQDLAERQIGVSVVLPGFVRDAGMFAVAHRELPRFVRTRSPDDVAHAVVRAVRRNRAEIAVAPLSLRLSAALGGLAPSLACQVNRLLGCRDIASELAAAHRKNR